MKKLFLLALLVVGVVGFFYASSEGYLGGLSGSGDDKREIRDKTVRFFECLKFKEFKGEGSRGDSLLEERGGPMVPQASIFTGEILNKTLQRLYC